ncbi:hypothetical protein F5B22DRAFT_117011 [Xylaria bambusicola]|uniref:uncharacterized protein n=1 Tax=Xylaria bambusicola TaxID=326684 RepID=UPI002008BDB9|nr:uncharacterized protein F5B22DRAFT_117011 [Xylaria bambusicola]KAI0517309.1 hypothetical protein F5B22DRAFT_117011 [Xylaria bambusicola]
MSTITDFTLGREEFPCDSSARSFSVASAPGAVPSPYTPTSGRSTPVLLPFGNNIFPTGSEPVNFLDMGYPFQQQLVSPPLEYTQPHCLTESFGSYTGMPTLAWQTDGQPLYGERFTPDVNAAMGEAIYPPSYFSIQERSAALHQVQGRCRINKRTKVPMVMVERRNASNLESIPAMVCTSGAHKCPHPNCRDRKPFKRQEHLKRHQTTVHGGLDSVKCQFCSGRFNRNDNYRTHLKLHTETGGRTPYFAEAQAVYEEEMRKTKQRRQGNKRSGARADRRRVPS